MSNEARMKSVGDEGVAVLIIDGKVILEGFDFGEGCRGTAEKALFNVISYLAAQHSLLKSGFNDNVQIDITSGDVEKLNGIVVDAELKFLRGE